jgi:GNAT superfamily N-acetyltransferase
MLVHDLAAIAGGVQGKRRRRESRGDARARRARPGTRRPAYQDGHAVAWCAVAPREEYVRLGASKVWAPVDEEKVWSVSCFFVDKKARGKGLSVEVLKAAVEFAQSRGARIIEGYPQELTKKLPPAFVWMGVMPTFERAGFHEVARRSAKKPIMRAVAQTNGSPAGAGESNAKSGTKK